MKASQVIERLKCKQNSLKTNLDGKNRKLYCIMIDELSELISVLNFVSDDIDVKVANRATIEKYLNNYDDIEILLDLASVICCETFSFGKSNQIIVYSTPIIAY